MPKLFRLFTKHNSNLFLSSGNVKIKERKKVRIAILGSRGIPAAYGGYETITQELSVGLAQRGFDVSVTCESNDFKIKSGTYKDVNLVYFPVINSLRNISEVAVYDALSAVWASFNADIVYMLAYTSVPVLIIPKLFGKIVVVNPDGIEWKRRKYSKPLRFLLRAFEILAPKVANYIVVDSKALGAYYKNEYNASTVYIPYGTKEIEPLDSKFIAKYGLNKNGYFLVIARLEPENNVDIILEEFKRSGSTKKLVIVGPLKNTLHVKRMLESQSDRILFLGGIYEPKLQRMLRHNCFAYIHGHEVGGTNPTLVEALSCRNLIIALNVSFNREVAGKGALYFNKSEGSLAELINKIEKIDVDKLNQMKEQVYEKYKVSYSVDGMVDVCAKSFTNFFDSLKSRR
jgi:rhamnosyltransferase